MAECFSDPFLWLREWHQPVQTVNQVPAAGTFPRSRHFIVPELLLFHGEGELVSQDEKELARSHTCVKWQRWDTHRTGWIPHPGLSMWGPSPAEKTEWRGPSYNCCTVALSHGHVGLGPCPSLSNCETATKLFIPPGLPFLPEQYGEGSLPVTSRGSPRPGVWQLDITALQSLL